MMLRSLRCRLGTGASRMSLLSLCTEGRVKVISYLCRIFRKPTCSRKGRGRRHLHLMAFPRAFPGHAIYDPVGLCICFFGDPRGPNFHHYSSWSTSPTQWLQALSEDLTSTAQPAYSSVSVSQAL